MLPGRKASYSSAVATNHQVKLIAQVVPNYLSSSNGNDVDTQLRYLRLTIET